MWKELAKNAQFENSQITITKLDFLPRKHKVLLGQSDLEQKNSFVGNDPKESKWAQKDDSRMLFLLHLVRKMSTEYHILKAISSRPIFFVKPKGKIL